MPKALEHKLMKKVKEEKSEVVEQVTLEVFDEVVVQLARQAELQALRAEMARLGVDTVSKCDALSSQVNERLRQLGR